MGQKWVKNVFFQKMILRGSVCQARFFSINYPDFSPRFTLSWISPPSRFCILGDPQTKGDKIRIGYLTPAFSGAQTRAEVLNSQGSPNKGGQNQNWLPHPCLLGGPKEGGSAKFSGFPKQRGTKSELATSTLPS